MNESEQKIAILNRISFVLEGIRKMTNEQKIEILNLLLEDCKENGNDAFGEEIIKMMPYILEWDGKDELMFL